MAVNGRSTSWLSTAKTSDNGLCMPATGLLRSCALAKTTNEQTALSPTEYGGHYQVDISALARGMSMPPSLPFVEKL